MVWVQVKRWNFMSTFPLEQVNNWFVEHQRSWTDRMLMIQMQMLWWWDQRLMEFLPNRQISVTDNSSLSHSLPAGCFFFIILLASKLFPLPQSCFLVAMPPSPSSPLHPSCPPPSPRWFRQYWGTQGYFSYGQGPAWCPVLWEIHTCWGHTLGSNQESFGLSSAEGTVVRVKTRAAPLAMGPRWWPRHRHPAWALSARMETK